MKPILNIADAETRVVAHGELFGAKHALLSRPLGGQKLGASVTFVEPGRAAFPFHHHYGSEEHFFIVSGTGTLRLAAESYPVKPGDYIVHPPGGPETAHQLVNTGSEPLVYLALGVMVAPEVVGYPDSGKTGVTTMPFQQEGLRFIVKDETRHQAEYWDGEDAAAVQALVDKARG